MDLNKIQKCVNKLKEKYVINIVDNVSYSMDGGELSYIKCQVDAISLDGELTEDTWNSIRSEFPTEEVCVYLIEHTKEGRTFFALFERELINNLSYEVKVLLSKTKTDSLMKRSKLRFHLINEDKLLVDYKSSIEKFDLALTALRKESGSYATSIVFHTIVLDLYSVLVECGEFILAVSLQSCIHEETEAEELKEISVQGPRRYDLSLFVAVLKLRFPSEVKEFRSDCSAYTTKEGQNIYVDISVEDDVNQLYHEMLGT